MWAGRVGHVILINGNGIIAVSVQVFAKIGRPAGHSGNQELELGP